MKTLLIAGLITSLSAFANSGGQGTGYAPNDGSAKPGNPGTFTTPKAGLGKAAPATTGRGTDINGAGTMGTSATTPNSASPAGVGGTGSVSGSDMATGNDTNPSTEAGNANLEKANTSANPIPSDTTLEGNSTQTGPYQTGKNKQSQEATDEELDYRSIQGVDHDDQNASENQ